MSGSIQARVSCLYDEVTAGGTSVAMLSLEAPSDQAVRSTLQVLLVVDVSGSMDEPVVAGNNLKRLDLVKESIKYIVDILGEEDQLAIATFAEAGKLNFQMTKMTDTGKLQATSVVEGLNVLGCTNMEAGLEAGAKAFTCNRSTGMNVILLLSDGDVNDGKKDHALVSYANDIVESLGDNTRLFTFGLGTNDTPQLLLDIASVGRGTYSHLLHEDDCPTSFASVVGTMATVAGKEIEVTLKSMNGVTIEQCEHDGDTWQPLGQNSFLIKIADIASGEGRHLPVKFTLPKNATKGTSLQVLSFHGKYKTPDDSVENFVEYGQVKVSSSHRQGQPDFELECQLARLRVANSIRMILRPSRKSMSKRAIRDTLLFLKSHQYCSTAFFKTLYSDLDSVNSALEGGEAAIGQRLGFMLSQEFSKERHIRPGRIGSGLFATKLQIALATDSVRFVRLPSAQTNVRMTKSSNPLKAVPRVGPKLTLAKPLGKKSTSTAPRQVLQNGPSKPASTPPRQVLQNGPSKPASTPARQVLQNGPSKPTSTPPRQVLLGSQPEPQPRSNVPSRIPLESREASTRAPRIMQRKLPEKKSDESTNTATLSEGAFFRGAAQRASLAPGRTMSNIFSAARRSSRQDATETKPSQRASRAPSRTMSNIFSTRRSSRQDEAEPTLQPSVPKAAKKYDMTPRGKK